jgi:hypothetical protein
VSKVLVIELPDDFVDPRDALILLAHGASLAGSHVHVAIRDDAEKVLSVFRKVEPSSPGLEETP